MEHVLLVTNPARRCGVHEFGKSTFLALQCSKRYSYRYQELSEQATTDELLQCVEAICPVAVIFNWHPRTMPWLNDDVLYALNCRFPTIRSVSIVHDSPAPFEWIDGNIFYDPSHLAREREFIVGRRLWNRPTPSFDPGPVIGSFGFGLGGKGFQRVVEQVNKEFDQATVRLHIPYSDYCDPEGTDARSLIAECTALAKPGINVIASSDYLSTEDMLDWLTGNAINCFFYDEFRGPGISSVIDFALSARRPIAITPASMFRHIVSTTPSILIGQKSLKEIMRQGIAPLEEYYKAWNEQHFVEKHDDAIDSIRTQPSIDLRGNRVLTPRDRQRLRPVVEDLTALCPEIMARKFPDAVFQNAFIFEQARQLIKSSDRVILIGGYEDPIGPSLQRLGYNVVITDPQVDGRTSDDVLFDAIREAKEYDLVISCSVIEHVEEDFEFVKTLYEMLAPGGTALLTTDFRDGWQPGINKPGADIRLYSLQRLRMMASILPAHAFPNGHNWQSVPPYFHCDHSDYGFCSLMFRKPENDQKRTHTIPFLVQQLDRARSAGESLNKKVQLLTEETQLLSSTIQQLVGENQRLVGENKMLTGEAQRPQVGNRTPSHTIQKWSQDIPLTYNFESFIQSFKKQSRRIRFRRIEKFAKRVRASVGL